MDNIIRPLLPYLPPDLSALLVNPPSLSSPQSFYPLVRLAWPFAKYAVVVLAFWIVFATLSGIFGYFTRFLRLAFKIGPIIGIISYFMGGSGQGGLGQVFDIARNWAGMGGQPGQTTPGLASLAGMFGGDQAGANTRGRKSTRNTGAQNGGPDMMSSIFNTAANFMGGGGAGGGGWSDVVQDFVKQAMNSAAQPPPETAEEKRRKRKAGL
ncbi:uncharacterized protein MKK02DRAFT_32782 [Dioszegia hungarica]|uniref:Uncharacterized protein n=1 Tax=Dioszegia hungarica TaxID=4972 RepID=A0AA38H9H8_9TREE|nr:uncharacterized protein MKK02DRAFT_32782 [Dioszegia hungarica]KAI9635329.1 hypothetical protein MKK02DRAFT_32782 [Dioszegia hungarica]